jgi:hypothetical protein
MTTEQPPSDDVMREQRLQRNLKILVVVLGLFIFIGLGAVIARIVWMAGSTAKHGETAGLSAAAQSVPFVLPKGQKVVSISLSGNRLAVHHEGPAGPGIAILDAETGRPLLNVAPIEAPPQ